MSKVSIISLVLTALKFVINYLFHVYNLIINVFFTYNTIII